MDADEKLKNYECDGQISMQQLTTRKDVITARDAESTLRAIMKDEEIIRFLEEKDLPVKQTCQVALRSLKAWGEVLQELTDVITTLAGIPDATLEDVGYSKACIKIRELVFRQLGHVKKGDS